MNIKTRTSGLSVVFAALLLVFSALLLSGCGSEKAEELEAYRKKMDGFFTTLSDCSDQMSAIDPSSDTASDDLLTIIDRISNACMDAAAVEAPAEYRTVQEMAVSANESMTEAKENFHKAFEGDFDEDAYNKGMTAYDDANEKIRSMISYLHGEETDSSSSIAPEEEIPSAESSS